MDFFGPFSLERDRRKNPPQKIHGKIQIRNWESQSQNPHCKDLALTFPGNKIRNSVRELPFWGLFCRTSSRKGFVKSVLDSFPESSATPLSLVWFAGATSESLTSDSLQAILSILSWKHCQKPTWKPTSGSCSRRSCCSLRSASLFAGGRTLVTEWW